MQELQTRELAKELAIAAKLERGRGGGRGRGLGRVCTEAGPPPTILEAPNPLETPSTSGCTRGQAGGRGRGRIGRRRGGIGRGGRKKSISSSDNDYANEENICCVCCKLITVGQTYRTCRKCVKDAHLEGSESVPFWTCVNCISSSDVSDEEMEAIGE